MEKEFRNSREQEEEAINERRRLSTERAVIATKLLNQNESNDNIYANHNSDDTNANANNNTTHNEDPNDSIDAEIDSMKNRLHLQKIRANIKPFPPPHPHDQSSQDAYNENMEKMLNLATYENILSPKISQPEIFDKIGKPMIVNLLQNNAPSICYALGPEGSGKSYTMFGSPDESDYEEALGLIPRVTIHLMANMNDEANSLKIR